MRYIKCEWLHEHPEEPVLLYSELNDDRYEVRKVERYVDGRTGFSSPAAESLGTLLGSVPVPEIAEINADRQFRCVEIARSEFEQVWQAAAGTGAT